MAARVLPGIDIFSVKTSVAHVEHERCKLVVSTTSTGPNQYSYKQYVSSDKAVTKLCIGVEPTAGPDRLICPVA